MRPPCDRPIAGRAPPFASARRAVRLHRRAIDENLCRRSARLRERMEQLAPNAFGRPAHIAIVERLLRSVFWRRIDAASARFQDVNNAADHPPIIDSRLAPRVGGKMRRDPGELRLRQPELIENHRRFLSEPVNHNQFGTPRILWVWTRRRHQGNLRNRRFRRRQVLRCGNSQCLSPGTCRRPR